MGKQGRAQGLARLPLQERPGSADDDLQALPLRDPQRLRQARPGAAGPRQRQGNDDRDRLLRRRAPAAGIGSVGARLQAALEAAGHASNWELVSAKHSANGHPIAVMGPQVGYYVPQILMEEDLHGPGHRRPRRLLRRGQPLRRARPRPRLRLERDHGDLRQRRHLRRGALQGHRPLPATAASAWRWKSWKRPRAGRRTRSTRPRPAPRPWSPTGPCTGSSSPAARCTGKQGRLRPRAQHLLPRGRLGDRVRAAERTGRRHRMLAASRRRSPTSTSSSTGPTSTPNTSPTRSRGRCRSGPSGTSPDFPILGTGQYDWKGFNPATQLADYLPFSKHPQAVDPPLPGLLEQQAGAGMGRGRRQVRLRAAAPPADDRRQGARPRPRARRR